MPHKWKVRFNLGAGKNYMKWKVTDPYGTAKYYDPSTVNITMADCRLMNQRGTAEKIFNGQHKTVCAWIEAGALSVYPSEERLVKDKVTYNPRVAPHWVYKNRDADKDELMWLITVGRNIFTY